MLRETIVEISSKMDKDFGDLDLLFDSKTFPDDLVKKVFGVGDEIRSSGDESLVALAVKCFQEISEEYALQEKKELEYSVELEFVNLEGAMEKSSSFVRLLEGVTFKKEEYKSGFRVDDNRIVIYIDNVYTEVECYIEP